ncbi:MAG: 4'-phosphopantetheinyl transferase superfamily protein [Chloroflexi bacterium]|nr:4'-phosphopantetheinyl transferase superfamily protein [Chloroflexota bacterium]
MQKDDWMTPPNILVLQPNQVHVWRVFLDRGPVSAQWIESTLSAEEAERAARFHFDRDRQRFVIAHAALRDILSRYLGCRPKALTFSVNSYGKPELTNHELEFNLSHSGDYALIAAARGHKVGVDVEHIRMDKDLESIANRFFSPSELSEFMALPPERKAVGFFNCWTRKEAYIKAQGLGLSLSLDSFDVSLTPNEPAILRTTRPNPAESVRWALRLLVVHSDYIAAVAVEDATPSPPEGQGLEFRLWDWDRQIK